jgi:6-phosphogluconate dehydrogenase (decarboxylating)
LQTRSVTIVCFIRSLEWKLSPGFYAKRLMIGKGEARSKGRDRANRDLQFGDVIIQGLNSTFVPLISQLTSVNDIQIELMQFARRF